MTVFPANMQLTCPILRFSTAGLFMYKTAILLPVLFSALCVTAQKYTALIKKTDGIVSSIENTKLKTDTLIFFIDSIYVNVKYNPKKIVADNIFLPSNRSIAITYYFRSDSLLFIQTTEKNRDNKCTTQFYFSNNKIVNENYFSRAPFHCVSFTIEEIEDVYGCPNRVDRAFLRMYFSKLLEKIKSEANKKSPPYKPGGL
ncbi:MAG: hypothetical protein JNK14_09815 [Chitinophagaceae bacterium]|nr:hypothetical protein [Chitinophagaceae bacterium]